MEKPGQHKSFKRIKIKRPIEYKKAEYEAEETTDEEIFFLKDLCDSADLGLHVKIGGVEAKRDFRRCLIIGVEALLLQWI